MPRYTWINKETGDELEVDVAISQRAIPPDESGNWERPLQMPSFKRASYLDGQRAKSDKHFQNAKHAAQLEVDHAQATDKKERSDIRKTIDKLTKLEK